MIKYYFTVNRMYLIYDPQGYYNLVKEYNF